MKQIFKPEEKDFPRIPDGTLLSPFLNPKDSMSDLSFDLIDGFSLAMGIIEKKTSSKIHVHPHVDQVTYVLSGKITLNMKSEKDEKPYSLLLAYNQAAISVKGEFVQFDNPYPLDCHLLFIVSPAFLFESKNDNVLYNDAVILNQSWEELEKMNWLPPELEMEKHSKRARNEAYRRLQKQKSI